MFMQAGGAVPACMTCSALPMLLRANRSNRFDRYLSAAAAVAVAASTQIGSARATTTSFAACDPDDDLQLM